MRKRNRWAEPLAAAIVGGAVVAVVATIWEAAGGFVHGPVRFIVSSGLFGLMVYVLQAKPVKQ